MFELWEWFRLGLQRGTGTDVELGYLCVAVFVTVCALAIIFQLKKRRDRETDNLGD